MTTVARFQALPVGRGDSFLLQTAGKTILVDGGQSRDAVASLLVKNEHYHLDVVVCTHADSDHARGVLGVVDNLSLEIEELWLPGQWTENLGDLLRHPTMFFDQLEFECADAASEDADAAATSLEDYADGLNSRREGGLDRGRAREEGRDTLEISAIDLALEDAKELEPFEMQGADRLAKVLQLPWEGDILVCWNTPPWQRLVSEAVATANLIREIAVTAANRGIHIRWFDFDEAQRSGSSGGEAYLKPLNARELVTVPGRRKRYLDYLALSVANKRSLVFLSPGDNRADVVFCADSDLAFKLPNIPQKSLFTAPHHGSESNAVAYAKMNAQDENVVLVRSDARYRKRPGNSYTSHPGTHFCTLCNGLPRGARKQTVVLEWDGRWTPTIETTGCSCPVSNVMKT